MGEEVKTITTQASEEEKEERAQKAISPSRASITWRKFLRENVPHNAKGHVSVEKLVEI